MTVFKVQQPSKVDGIINDFFSEMPSFGKRIGNFSPMVNILENKEQYTI